MQRYYSHVSYQYDRKYRIFRERERELDVMHAMVPWCHGVVVRASRNDVRLRVHATKLKVRRDGLRRMREEIQETEIQGMPHREYEL